MVRAYSVTDFDTDDVTFLTSAIGPIRDGIGFDYTDFCAPYIASALIMFEKSSAEVVVLDYNKYRKTRVFKNLQRLFGNRFLVRNVESDWEVGRRRGRGAAMTVRFTTVPKSKKDFTVITDADYLITNVGGLKGMLADLGFFSIPYYNQVRGRGNPKFDEFFGRNKFVGGLHAVRTEEYYSRLKETGILKKYKENGRYGDDRLLALMCKEAFGYPAIDQCPRVHPGIHISPARNPVKGTPGPGWGAQKLHLEGAKKLFEDDRWKDIKRFFSASYLEKLRFVEMAIDGAALK